MKNKLTFLFDGGCPLCMRETNFLKKAKAAGNKIENGKMMFVYQAQLSFKIWHNIKPKIDNTVIKLLGDD